VANCWQRNGFDWLADLSEADSERLRHSSSSQLYARGAIVFEPAAQPQSVYLLEQGLVRIYRLSAEAAETTLGYVRAGEVFGELEVFSDRPRESFALSVRPSRIWQVPRVELHRVLGSHPRIAISVSEQIVRRFKRVESRVESLALRSLRSRIGHILLELAEDFGRAVDGKIQLDLPLNQLDLATLVGATRQSVNACLRDLRDAELLVYRERRFSLPDPAALRASIAS
jgi:CRP/FNR family transcriptional regulator, cyclic AMP receptor protein